MQLDLKKDAASVRAMLERRLASLIKMAKSTPIPPVSYINLGFQYDQDGWVSLFLDHRENGEPDGEWTQHIEKNMIKMPHWLQAYEALDNEELVFHMPDGSPFTVPEGIPDEDYARLFGDMLKNVLLTARTEGLFRAISKREHCELGVEELEGRYGWPVYEDRRKGNLA